MRFGRVEPPRTHVKLHHRSGSLPCAMVREGSVGLNHPELMSSSTTGLVPCPVLWFEQVGRVEPPRTHVKLNHNEFTVKHSTVNLSMISSRYSVDTHWPPSRRKEHCHLQHNMCPNCNQCGVNNEVS